MNNGMFTLVISVAMPDNLSNNTTSGSNSSNSFLSFFGGFFLPVKMVNISGSDKFLNKFEIWFKSEYAKYIANKNKL